MGNLNHLITPDPATLRGLLTQAGLTQSGFAAFLGVDGRTVRKWVAGERDISPPALLWLRLAAEQPELFAHVRELLADSYNKPVV